MSIDTKPRNNENTEFEPLYSDVGCKIGIRSMVLKIGGIERNLDSRYQKYQI